MDVLFIGSKDRGVRCLESVLNAGFDVVGVVTTADDDPDAFWDRSVEAAAQSHDLPVYTPADINAPSFVETLEDLDADLFVMSGYNQILDETTLSVPAKGVINLHAGKLPDYRGGSPMNWAIINGESSGVASIHYATERIDAGPILAEETYEIGRNDTIADIRERVNTIYERLLVDVVTDIEQGTATTREQSVSEGTYYGSRRPQDGEIHWHRMTAREVYDFVRALTHPYPGAFTEHDGTKLYVWSASLLDETIKHAPGRVCMRRGDGRVVAARDMGVMLETVQPADGQEVAASEYLEQGEYLG